MVALDLRGRPGPGNLRAVVRAQDEAWPRPQCGAPGVAGENRQNLKPPQRKAPGNPDVQRSAVIEWLENRLVHGDTRTID
jgi:hypothetical protein